ncbi:MAG TPA: Rne/Rng family ribonuclease, partial [Nocardioidaceae bacterium]|nr:Rne/Rng family ribonuclease [Nocardioidaceae bacterium]
MLDQDSGSAAPEERGEQTDDEPRRRRAVSRPAGPPAATAFSAAEPPVTPTKKTATKKTATKKAATKKTSSKQKTQESGAEKPDAEKADATAAADSETDADEAPSAPKGGRSLAAPFAAPLFQAPDPVRAPARSKDADHSDDDTDDSDDGTDPHSNGRADDADGDDGGSDDGSGSSRRRRRRGGRRRRRNDDDTDEQHGSDDSAGSESGSKRDSDAKQHADSGKGSGKGSRNKPHDGKADASSSDDKSDNRRHDDDKSDDDKSDDDKSDDDNGGSSRRRRRRRRKGEDPGPGNDDPANTVTKVRERRSAEDEITSVSGSTRLEAKKQRRREGREAGRRRAPIVTESEFLARRESVKREMVIRQRPNLSQIAVLEDDVLVEHYVAAAEQSSMIGNVYLGRVQNVLPSMEAAFIDIGKGRNGVLYAGEVDWKALGNGKPRKIEEVLKSGQTVLVQVTKDPVGHKGARLTSQISLAGRFLVYVPGGQTNGISRKLPDTERSRLKGLLKDILPEEAGVIIRTAAEGATEEQLNRDVSALTARWDDIEKKSQKPNAPQLLYAEPDLMIKVVRDLFNEDFAKLTVEGDEAWDMIEGYVQHVAPDLADRLERWKPDDGTDVFESYRIDEQIAKATDRKVWLPSGGSLIIDRTEAMTVIDVNTGKFTGSGGNLEETVTKNNLEAAEEIVRQLRLRDIGGIVVIDFIDMVLENNRDLVLRRLVECLGRDRTRHQVAEVTSLGLVQMTRKRIGTGLVEAFSETCEHCNGRGLVVHSEPIEPRKREEPARGRRRTKGRGDKSTDNADHSGDSSGDKSAKNGEKPDGGGKKGEKHDKGGKS